MAIFLVRDFDAATGFREYQPVGGLLPRTRQESYVPWAITQAQQVVYAKLS